MAFLNQKRVNVSFHFPFPYFVLILKSSESTVQCSVPSKCSISFVTGWGVNEVGDLEVNLAIIGFNAVILLQGKDHKECCVCEWGVDCRGVEATVWEGEGESGTAERKAGEVGVRAQQVAFWRNCERGGASELTGAIICSPSPFPSLFISQLLLYFLKTICLSTISFTISAVCHPFRVLGATNWVPKSASMVFG